jgi:formiminotetrahydrofolate cyclodeaminase
MKPTVSAIGKKPLQHYTLEAFMAELASEAISPGAGAAGGITLALAAACAGKAVAITRRHQSDSRLDKLQMQLERITESALSLAELDAQQFRRQLQSDRPAAIHALLHTDYTILDTCRALDALLEEHACLIPDNMVGDWKAARVLSDACLFIQLANVREFDDSAK